MVVANIKAPELAAYEGLHPRFAMAFEEIKAQLKKEFPDGRKELDGDALYVSASRYETKLPGEAKFEAHRKYIDIQVILEGEEIIRFEDQNKLARTTEYDEVKDIEFFAMNRQFDSVRLGVGDLAIIFPGEAHAPCITVEAGPTPVRKLVVKVLAE